MVKKRKAGNNSGARDPPTKRQREPDQGHAVGLQWLLGQSPTVEGFRKSYFERKHLHIKRDAEKYYRDFLDLSTPDALFELMDKGVVPPYRLKMFRCKDGSNKEEPSPPPASAAEVRKLFKEGWSIQWLQPQQEHDKLAKFVSVLESEFGSLVGVNAYLTPPGVQGLAPHWDDVEVLVLQLGGQKTWTLHSESSTVPLPPSAQTLPRYSSGDLPYESLSPAIAEVALKPGDLLYFPRGTIHYAPNKNKQVSSVHLTISTYQQQTLYDLTQKAFEEVMSEAWENDEALRRGLPWQAFKPGSREYSSMRKAVAAMLRRAAEAAEQEEREDCSVAKALQVMGQEFVQHRMPPNVRDLEDVPDVRPNSSIAVPDPTVFTFAPAPDDSEAAEFLVHGLNNSRRNHMMKHPDSDNASDRHEDDEEAEEAEEESRSGDASVDDDSGIVPLSAEAAQVLRLLCEGSEVCLPGAEAVPAGQSLAPLMLEAGLHESKWPGICSVLTELAAMGLVSVCDGSAAPTSSVPKKIKKKKKKT